MSERRLRHTPQPVQRSWGSGCTHTPLDGRTHQTGGFTAPNRRLRLPAVARGTPSAGGGNGAGASCASCRPSPITRPPPASTGSSFPLPDASAGAHAPRARSDLPSGSLRNAVLPARPLGRSARDTSARVQGPRVPGSPRPGRTHAGDRWHVRRVCVLCTPRGDPKRLPSRAWFMSPKPNTVRTRLSPVFRKETDT